MTDLKWLANSGNYYYFGNPPKHPIGVSLNKTVMVLYSAGQTEQLTATINPSDVADTTIIWSSSDTSIATVSSTGLVTCVTPGNCTITATTLDGGRTATCTVNGIRQFNYLTVGGGGGGHKGGGGGAAVCCGTAAVTKSSYTITIGTAGYKTLDSYGNVTADVKATASSLDSIVTANPGCNASYTGGGTSGTGCAGGGGCSQCGGGGGGGGATGIGETAYKWYGCAGGAGLYGYGGGGGGAGGCGSGCGKDGGGNGGGGNATNCGGGGGGHTGVLPGKGAGGVVDICYLANGGCGINSATGGTISTVGQYKVHRFTSNGTFTITG